MTPREIPEEAVKAAATRWYEVKYPPRTFQYQHEEVKRACRDLVRPILAAALPLLEAAWRERLLSDEVVEAAAKARWEYERHPRNDKPWDEMEEPTDRNYELPKARVQLQAALATLDTDREGE